MHELGVAEAQMNHGRRLHARERAIERLDRVASGDLGCGLDPWLIELNDVGAGLLEIVSLLIECGREIQRELLSSS